VRHASPVAAPVDEVMTASAPAIADMSKRRRRRVARSIWNAVTDSSIRITTHTGSQGAERSQTTTSEFSIAEAVGKSLVADTTAGPNGVRYDDRAVRCVKSCADPVARLLIFQCFGFGQNSYLWVGKLPEDIEVWTVGTTKASSWEELVGQIAPTLRTLFDKPVVAWGHSMGAIIAYEVLSHLEQSCGLMANAIVLSSSVAPFIFARAKYASPFYEIAATNSDQEVEQRLIDNHLIVPRSAGIPMISPEGLRNDVQLTQTYCYDSDKQLSAPLYLIRANNDVIVSDPLAILQWDKIGRRQSCYEEIEGTHLFFTNPPRRFLQLLKELCSASRPAERENITGVYTVKKMMAGTADMHLYPFGSDACGYVIFAEQGQMAVHLWHRSRQAAGKRQHSAAEAYLTYLAYAATYRCTLPTLDYQVIASTAPDMEGKALRSYVDRAADGMALSTGPVVTRSGAQEECSAYQRLLCDRLQGEFPKRAARGTAGCWTLVALERSAGGPEWGECKGQCIVTADGMMSVVISTAERSRSTFRNPMLAPDSELQSAIETVVSWLGRVTEDELGREIVTALMCQAPDAIDPQHISIEVAGDKLKIGWFDSKASGTPTIQARWSRSEDCVDGVSATGSVTAYEMVTDRPKDPIVVASIST
jgi:surfactin synthase thioesterase subunit